MKNDWKIKKLGDVCDVLDSLRKPITKRDRIEGEFPYYGATGILSYVNGYLFDEKLVLIGEDGAKWSSGDKTSFIVEGKYWVNNHAHVIRPNRNFLLDEWLVFFLNFSDLTPFISGMTVPKLNQEKMRGIPIPVPPLSEQRRIVAVLDKCFSVIDKVKANTERCLSLSKDLFESYLQGVFENGAGWEMKALEELADENCSLSYGIVQPGNDFEGGLPVVRPTDLVTQYVKKAGLKVIDPKLAEGYKRTKLIGNELLLCVRGTTGVISIATKELEGANVTRGIVPIRFNLTKLNQMFGYYALTSKSVQDQIKEKTYGAALMQINIGDLRKISVSFPKSKAEQQTIVHQLDALRTETQKLESVYRQKVADLEELKKSILHKAFRGELTEKEEV